MSYLVDKTVKDYRFIEVIGKGGMGIVYRALQQTIQRYVAVKVLHPELANNDAFVRSFLVEAQLIGNLEHANIVPLYDYWREPDSAFLVMRLIDSGSLRQALEQKPRWDPPRALKLMEQITAALSIAHNRLTPIVHSDIKPENILLDKSGNAYLSDFGLAPDVLRENNYNPYTPAYAAPEQIQKRGISPQTDIYALGIVLFELLAGKRPFDESTISDIEAHHINDPVPAVTQVNSRLPSALDEVIWKATSKDPADRYPSAIDLAKDFGKAIGMSQQSAETPILILPTGYSNPYKGLSAFTINDQDSFFGRKTLTDRLVNRIRETRFLAVIGPSGSGKSSLVQAGLLGTLRHGRITAFAKWQQVLIRPGENPFVALADALGGVLREVPRGLADLLRSDATALNRLVRDALLGDAESQLLLVVDQFEEIFTLVRDEQDRQHFMESLRLAVEAPDSRLRVVITLRADFYGHPLQYPDFAKQVIQGNETVPLLNRAELEEAIVKPAELLGVRMEPSLVNEIISSIGQQPGMLPLLQYALTQLFAKRSDVSNTLSLREYRAIGGISGALADSAENLYARLPSAEHREKARILFLRLVTINNDMEATRRRARRTELLPVGAADPVMEDVLSQFDKARLLTFDRDPATREPTIEIAHEALIRSWKTYRTWIDTNQNDIRLQRQLESDAQKWIENGRVNDFLVSGGPLSQYEALAKRGTMELSSEENDFLRASLGDQHERERQELERVERELTLAREAAEQQRQAAENAQQLAEQRQRAARRARSFGVVLGLLAAVAVVFGVVARLSAEQTNAAVIVAQDNANTATIAQGQALQQAGTATIAQGQALQQAGTATVAQGQALQQALTVTVAQGQALQQAGTATVAQGQALQQAGTATVAQGQALQQALTVTVAQGQALQQAGTATVAQGQAQLAAANAFAQATAAQDSANRASTQQAIAQTSAANEASAKLEAQANAANAATNAADAQDQANLASTQQAIAQTSAANEANAKLEAQANAASAATNAADAQNKADLASTQQAVAQNNAKLAQAAQLTSDANAADKATNAAVAQNNAGTAQAAQATVVAQSVLTRSQSLAARAELLLNAGEYQLALPLAVEANTIEGASIGAQRILSQAAYSGPIDIQREPNGAVVNAVVYCPSRSNPSWWLTGSEQPSGGGGAVTAWQYSTIRSSTTNHFLRRSTIPNTTNKAVTAITCNADGTRAAWGTEGGLIVIWDLRSGGQIAILDPANPDGKSNEGAATPTGTAEENNPTAGRVTALAFNPEAEDTDAGTFLMAAYNAVDDENNHLGGRLWLWNIAEEKVEQKFTGRNTDESSDSIADVAFSPRADATGSERNLVISVSVNGELILWDWKTYEIVKRVKHDTALRTVAYNNAGTQIATGDENGQIQIWDAGTLQRIPDGTLTGHSGPVTRVRFDESDSYLISAGSDRNIILWNANSYKPLRRFRAHEKAVADVTFGQGFLVSASLDGTTMLWSLNSGAERERLESRDITQIISSDYNARGDIIAASGTHLLVWRCSSFACFGRDAKDAEVSGSVQHEAPVNVVVFNHSPQANKDGLYALSGDQQGFVILWDMDANRRTLVVPIRKWDAQAGAVTGIAFSPDGRYVITAGEDRKVRMWDVLTGERIGEALDGPNDVVTAVTMNERLIAAGAQDGKITLWDSQSRKVLPTVLQGHSEPITALAFSPDGQLLISASTDRTLIAWSMKEDDFGQRLDPLFRQHTGAVRSVAFNRDGKWIITTSDDGTVVVWDVASRTPIRILEGHTGTRLNQARFSWNSAQAVSSDADGRIIRWRIDNQNQLISWTLNNRFGARLEEIELPERQICDIVREYNLNRRCDNAQVAAATPFATATLAPSPTFDLISTPTPTAIPTATASPVLSAAQQPGTAVAAAAVPDIPGWHEAERVSWNIINLSFESNVVRSYPLSNPYTDYMVHAQIDFGPGSLQDQCGFSINREDKDNYRLITIDQLNKLYDSTQSGGKWENGTVDSVGTPLAGVSTRTTADMALVVHAGSIEVYVNADWSRPPVRPQATLSSGAGEGYVALSGVVFETSRESSCTFRDVWVVDLTSDSTPVPTVTPTAPAPLVVDAANPPLPDSVIGQLRERGFATKLDDNGEFLSERNSRQIIDISDLDDFTQSLSQVENSASYQDFVMGAVVSWETSKPEDQCGFAFRYTDLSNYYTLSFDQQNHLWFDSVDNGVWQTTRTLNASFIKRGAGQRNYILLVGQDTKGTSLKQSRFSVFVNGTYVGDILDSQHPQGAVALVGGRSNSDQNVSRCIFENVWVWNLSQSRPAVQPTVTAVEQQTSIAVGDAPVQGNLPVGGREVWTFTAAEGDILTIVAEAERPANDASPQDSVARRLLDVEVRLTSKDHPEVTRVGSDLNPGKDTNASIEKYVVPADGEYQVEIYSRNNLTGGKYRLKIVRENAQNGTSPLSPSLSPTATP
jgi:WD40 repeat protein/serine/threonine protein kinase